MARMLRLTNEQFDSLYDIVADTIEYLETEDCDLNDYEIYQVWQQLVSLKNDASNVRISDDNYGDKVDTLVGNMRAFNDNEFTHDSEGC